MSTDPLPLLLRSFCLTTMAGRYAEMLASAEQNNWGYRKFLLHLCESEAADRKERQGQTNGLIRGPEAPCRHGVVRVGVRAESPEILDIGGLRPIP